MPAPWTAIDLVTAALAAATVILGAVALCIGLFAIWGYRDIRHAAEKAAETASRGVAEQVARAEIRAFLDKQEAAPDISQGYQDKLP